MLVLGTIVVAISDRVGADQESAASLASELPRLITACNRVVEGGSGKRRAMSACETLAEANLLGRAEPAASTAYQQRRADLEQWEACQRSQLAVPFDQRLRCPRAAYASNEPKRTTNDLNSRLRGGCEQPSAPAVPADIAIGSRADNRLSREIALFVADSVKYVSCLRAAAADDPATITQKEAEFNAAIVHINARRFGDARAAIDELALDDLSSFERSKAEQVLYTIAYEEEKLEEAREHVLKAIDAGGLSASDTFKARLALTNIDVMLSLRNNQLHSAPGAARRIRELR